MDQNHEAFDKQGIKVVQAYLQGSIDEKLSARLATMRNDEGQKKNNRRDGHDHHFWSSRRVISGC